MNDDKLSKLSVDMAVVKNDVKHIKQMLSDTNSRYEDHIETSQGFRDKVTRLNGIRGEVFMHRWVFGLIITILAVIIHGTYGKF